MASSAQYTQVKTASDATGSWTWQKVPAALPSYASVALAQAAGLVSGDYFILTGTVVGILTLNLIVAIP